MVPIVSNILGIFQTDWLKGFFCGMRKCPFLDVIEWAGRKEVQEGTSLAISTKWNCWWVYQVFKAVHKAAVSTCSRIKAEVKKAEWTINQPLFQASPFIKKDIVAGWAGQQCPSTLKAKLFPLNSFSPTKPNENVFSFMVWYCSINICYMLWLPSFE